MKTSKILAVLLAAVVLVSCNNDDESGPYELNETNLIGHYELVYKVDWSEETSIVNGVETVRTTTYVADTFDFSWTFLGHTGCRINGNYRIVKTIDVDGQTVEQTTRIFNVDNGTIGYFLDLETSILHMGDTFNVSSFDETGLIISEYNEGTNDGVSYAISHEMRFVRI